MLHLDYASGYIPWENVQGQSLITYTCYDSEGRLVKVTPKKFNAHDSWRPVQGDPAYHYNLGNILQNPDNIAESTSQNPQAIAHRQEGEVLLYEKKDYIIDINSPSMSEYMNTTTTVVVKYTDDGNYTLTSTVFRSST